MRSNQLVDSIHFLCSSKTLHVSCGQWTIKFKNNLSSLTCALDSPGPTPLGRLTATETCIVMVRFSCHSEIININTNVGTRQLISRLTFTFLVTRSSVSDSVASLSSGMLSIRERDGQDKSSSVVHFARTGDRPGNRETTQKFRTWWKLHISQILGKT